MRITHRQSSRLLFVFLLAAGGGPEPAAECATSGLAPSLVEPANLRAIVRQYANQLQTVSSDSEALTLYRTELGQALGLHDTLALLREQRVPARHRPSIPPPDLREPATRLAAELAIWHMASHLRAIGEATADQGLREWLETTTVQQQWLSKGADRQTLNRAVALAKVVGSFEAADRQQGDISIAYSRLVAYLDQSYPQLTTGNTSWLAIAKEHGATGVRRRLMEFAEHDQLNSPHAEQAAWRYFNERLRPVFLAQVVASAIRAEAEAEQHAIRLWSQLRSWRAEWNTRKGRARLCGTWLWTVHNHQNHQDHKMVITFPPSETPTAPEPQPARIIILGDGVYLRWEFPGGYQEDSLLFTGKGQRLEGTFVNSRGPWGSITGKRAAACKQKE